MEFAGECFEVLRPLRQHKAVSLDLDGSSNVTADLSRALLVLDEGAEYGLNAQLLVTGLLMTGGVRHKYPLNPEVLIVVRCHPVSLRSAIHRDELFEMIPPVGSRGQTEPVPYRHLTHDTLEGDRGDVMALVDNDEAIRLGDFAQILPTSEALCHRDVDGALCLVAAAAELTDLLGGHPEVLSETFSPLLDQRLPIDHYECGELAVGDDSAGDHGLARTWGRHEYTEMMWNERIQCTLLTVREIGPQGDVD